MWLTIGSGAGKGLSVKVEGERFLIGSGDECRLKVDDPRVDPLHAYFEVHDDGRVEVHDLGSETGTFVDGTEAKWSRSVHGGEVIRVGASVLTPTLEEPAERQSGRAEEPRDEPEPQSGRAAEPQSGRTAERQDEIGAELRFEPSVAREPFEIVPVRERRRLWEISTAALVAGAVALLLAIAGAVVALSAGGGTSTADIVRDARDKTVFVHANLGRGQATGSGWVVDAGRGLIAT